MFEYAFAARDLVIRASGRFGGPGKLEFLTSGELIDEVLLPKAEWAAFAVLALVSTNASAGSLEAFLSSSALAEQLLARKVIELDDPQTAIRTVFRLRKRLNALPIAALLAEERFIAAPGEFGKLLIHRNKLLGYRINVPPGNLKLDVVDGS